MTMTTAAAQSDLPTSAQWLNLASAARYLDTSQSTIRRRIAAGALRAFDISDPESPQSTIRIRRADLDALLRPIPNGAGI